MLVAGSEPLSTSTSSSSRHQEYFATREPEAETPPPPQQQLDLALEGKSILLQQRAPSHPGAPPHPQPPQQPPHHSAHQPADAGKTFSPLQLQLRIDLSGEQVLRPSVPEPAAPAAALTRRQRAQLRRRQEQQKPADQVVYQRRSAPRPRTPAACPRTPLAMSTMSMPAAGQKFAADDAAANVFGSAEETSAAVKRLLAKTGTSVVEEHHRVTSSSTKTSCEYLQDSFDFLHQRHMKNLSDVIARHQRQQLGGPGPGQLQQAPPAASQQDANATGYEQVHGGTQAQSQTVRHKKQVHIHQSAFYDGQSGMSDARDSQQQQQFRSTKTINLSNNNSSSNSSSCDLDDAKMLQQQNVEQQVQQRRCARENSTSSVQSQSSVSSERSNSFDNCNNNFCDTAVVNKSKTSSKTSSTSSTTSSSKASSTTRVQQSFSTKKQFIKQSFSSSSQDFEDRIGIDVMLTPSAPGTPNGAALVLANPPLDLAATAATASTKKVKQTTKVSSSSSTTSASSDQPDQVECKQSVKTFKSKTVKKSVSDGKHVHTDVDKFAETAEEEAEGSPEKPVITFSHVTSEGSHQTFSDEIVRFDSSALSSPSRSRSPSPLLEMPAPYNDLSKEIKRPPMEKA